MNSVTVSAGKRAIDFHYVGRSVDACYRHDVADEIKINVIIKGRIDCVRGRDVEEPSNGAHGFPACTLTCLLRLKGYGTYPAGATFGCSRLTL